MLKVIGDTSIYIGSYPETDADVFNLKSRGITGVLNLQTDREMEARGLDATQMT